MTGTQITLAVSGVPVIPLLGIAAPLGLMLRRDPAVLLAGLAITSAAAAMAVFGAGRRRAR